MLLFRIIQTKFGILGVTLAQSMQELPFNRRIILVYFIHGNALASGVTFLLKKANTFEEYTNNIYMTSASAMIMFCYTIVVSRMAKLFEFINEAEKTVDQGE